MNLKSSLIFRLFSHISNKRKRQYILAIFIVLCSGVAEIFSLAAVFPFLSVLLNPERLLNIVLFKNLFNSLGFYDPQDLILPVSLLFGFLSILSSGIKLFSFWLNARLSALVAVDLSYEVFRRTLYQPYSVHISRNSSKIISAISSYVAITASALVSLMICFSSLVLSISVFSTLLLTNFKLSFFTGILFSSAYLIIMKLLNNKILVNSKVIAIQDQMRIKFVQEGLGGIRDVILDSSQDYFLLKYNLADKKNRIKTADNAFFGILPRYLLESIGLLTVAFLAFILTLNKSANLDVIALLGVFGLGAQKLLNPMQMFYANWVQIKSSTSSIEEVLRLLDQPIRTFNVLKSKSYLFKREIRFKDISFAYSPGSQLILKNFDISINKGERVGIKGETGSGKSTFIDLIMGLIEPTSGEILIDGKNLSEITNTNLLKDWQSSIAHVPQNIFLADCSIEENIAFGLTKKDIRKDLLLKSAKQAFIFDYIKNLELGFKTQVGERGVRLSGGQRQRIGIARALYKGCNILIFDEATSALDLETEKLIMETIYSLNKDLTIFIIAHRTSTLDKCDRIIEISKRI